MLWRKGPAPEALWRSVDEDFVLGACSRRVIGFLNRGGDDIWTVFDDDARPLDTFADLDEAKAALWHSHRSHHENECTSPRTESHAHRPAGGAAMMSLSPPTAATIEPHRPIRPASW